MSSLNQLYLSEIDLNEIPDFEDDIPEDDPYRDPKDYVHQHNELQELWKKERGDYTRSDRY